MSRSELGAGGAVRVSFAQRSVVFRVALALVPVAIIWTVVLVLL